MDGASQNMAFLTDYGQEMLAVDLMEAARKNDTYRRALWSGENLQVTMMSLRPGEDIGLEIHPYQDQIILVRQGSGVVQMGPRRDKLTYRKPVRQGSAVFIPTGIWHNLTNTGRVPMKLIVLYGPGAHPYGTLQRTKAESNMQ